MYHKMIPKKVCLQLVKWYSYILVIEEDKVVSQSPLNAAAKEDSGLQTVVPIVFIL